MEKVIKGRFRKGGLDLNSPNNQITWDRECSMMGWGMKGPKITK